MQHYQLKLTPGRNTAWEFSALDHFPADQLNALLYGYSVYTTFRALLNSSWQAKHIERLFRDAAALKMCPPCTPSDLLTALQAHTFSALSETVFRLTCFPEVSTFHDLGKKPLPSICLLSTRPTPVLPQTLPWPDNLTLTLSATPRPLAPIKHGSMAPELLLNHATPNTEETLLITPAGDLCETPTANIVVEIGGRWLTPDPRQGHCLPGLTLSLLEPAFDSVGGLCRETISSEDLAHITAAFLCNAVHPIRPIQHLKTHLTNYTLPWPNDAKTLLEEAYQYYLSCHSVKA